MGQKRILIAEDHAITRKNIGRVLQDEGYEVLLAMDGREAVKLLDATSADLVLTDLIMPHLDGTDVLTYVKQSSPMAPVIVFTANATEEAEREVRRLGANDFLTKPLDLDDLLRRIWRMLSP